MGALCLMMVPEVAGYIPIGRKIPHTLAQDYDGAQVRAPVSRQVRRDHTRSQASEGIDPFLVASLQILLPAGPSLRRATVVRVNKQTGTL